MEHPKALPTSLWLDAARRQAEQRGIPFSYRRQGAVSHGTVLVVIEHARGAFSLFMQARNQDGVLGWLPTFQHQPVDSEQAHAYIDRAVSRDPDLWIIDTEGPPGFFPLEGMVFDA